MTTEGVHWYVCTPQIALPFVTELLTEIVVPYDDVPPRRALTPARQHTRRRYTEAKFGCSMREVGCGAKRRLDSGKDKVTSVRKWLFPCENHKANLMQNVMIVARVATGVSAMRCVLSPVLTVTLVLTKKLII